MIYLQQPAGWTPRHEVLARYVRSHRYTFATAPQTPQGLAAQLKADPAWTDVCRAVGSPDAQLIREVVASILPLWAGVDVDLIVEGVKLACADQVTAALILIGAAVVLLLLLLSS